MLWRFRIYSFDDGNAGGCQINLDLAELERLHPGFGYVQMEVSLPPSYPDEPPFLRVVTPRMVQYTGHVTVGGSICIPLLSLTSTLQGWDPQFSLENVIATVIANFTDAERVLVRTPSGPGGMAGPLRIMLPDTAQGYPYGWTLLAYSMAEARGAFQRVEAQHAGLW